MNVRSQAIEIMNVLTKEIFGDNKPDTSLTTKLFTEIRECLLKGISKDEMMSKILNYKENHPHVKKINSIQDILKEPYAIKQESTKANLIKPGIFYYHHRLQITPEMPTVSIDIVSGTFESKYERFYLRIVDKFTLQDLHDYAVSKVPILHINTARDLGSLQYLLKKYEKIKEPYNNLDLILYTIDAASGLIYDLDIPPLSSLLKLDDFIQEGWILYQDAYNRKKSAGLDREQY